MRKSLAVLSCAGMVGLLSACSGSWDVEGLKAMDSKGSAFDKALKSEYVALASTERSEYDWSDTAEFVERGKETAMGKSPVPESLDARTIPSKAVSDLTDARAQLMAYMNAATKSALPKQLAAAQAGYECWMQEQEENWQADDIAACRKKFDDAIQALGGKIVMTHDNVFTVYFPLNSYKLQGDALTIIKEAAAAYKATKAKHAAVSGHADSSGPANYNDSISSLRAEAIGDALIKSGLPESAVTISAFGEGDQAVKTPDGKTEPRNRRGTITLSK